MNDPWKHCFRSKSLGQYQLPMPVYGLLMLLYHHPKHCNQSLSLIKTTPISLFPNTKHILCLHSQSRAKIYKWPLSSLPFINNSSTKVHTMGCEQDESFGKSSPTQSYMVFIYFCDTFGESLLNIGLFYILFDIRGSSCHLKPAGIITEKMFGIKLYIFFYIFQIIFVFYKKEASELKRNRIFINWGYFR